MAAVPQTYSAGKQTPDLREALDDMFGEARAHLGTAETLLLSVTPEIRPAFLPLAQVRRDLRQLARADSDPFVARPPSRFPDVVGTVARIAIARLLGLTINSNPLSRN